jgi:hypothetical protein
MGRLERLEVVEAGGLRVHLARGWRARLLGLAWLAELAPGRALMIPRCRSVHTFGMRFRIDVVFYDRRGRVLRRKTGVGPGRVLACRGAHAVAETAAGESGRMPDPWRTVSSIG